MARKRGMQYIPYDYEAAYKENDYLKALSPLGSSFQTKV